MIDDRIQKFEFAGHEALIKEINEARKWLPENHFHVKILTRALVCLEASLDWCKDAGDCHFCSYDSPCDYHGENCPLEGV